MEAELATSLPEVQEFLNIQNDQALIPLNPLSYFAVIAFMGLCLVFGAIYSWLRKPWGYRLLAIYLSAHAGLFVNFQTINPKISILIGGIVLLILAALIFLFLDTGASVPVAITLTVVGVALVAVSKKR